MIKVVLAFIAVWAIVFFGISFFWHSPTSAKVDMFKAAVYSLGTAVVAFSLLSAIVILF
jgi:hypothetical protein